MFRSPSFNTKLPVHPCPNLARRYQRLMAEFHRADRAIPFRIFLHAANTFLVLAVFARVLSVCIPLPDDRSAHERPAPTIVSPDESVDDDTNGASTWQFWLATSLYRFAAVNFSWVVVFVFSLQTMIFRCVQDDVRTLAPSTV